MKKKCSLLLLFFVLFVTHLTANPAPIDSLQRLFGRTANRVLNFRQLKGDELTAVADTLKMLKATQNRLSPLQQLVLRIYLGNLIQWSDQPGEALIHYEEALNFYLNNRLQNNFYLSSIYAQIGTVAFLTGDNHKSIQYREKALRMALDEALSSDLHHSRIILLHRDIGKCYFELGNFQEAMLRYLTALDYSRRHRLDPTVDLLRDMARTYEALGQPDQAGQHYRQAIRVGEAANAPTMDLALTYRFYGRYLLQNNRRTEGLALYHKAIAMMEHVRGNRGTHLSSTYLLLGNDCKEHGDSEQALNYYQKAIIAACNNFDNRELAANPDIGKSLSDFSLLLAFRRKAETLLEWSATDETQRVARLKMALNTANMALAVVEKIRTRVASNKSRLIFNQNFKDVAITAMECRLALYTATGHKTELAEAFRLASHSKANLLRYEAERARLFSSAEFPDSLRQKLRLTDEALGQSAYMVSMLERVSHTDPLELNRWKDRNFELLQQKEQVTSAINLQLQLFPPSQVSRPLTDAVAVRRKLNPGENLIEYVISKPNEKGFQKLFIFVLNPQELQYYTSLISPSCRASMAMLTKELAAPQQSCQTLEGYQTFVAQLQLGYRLFFKPVEKYLRGTDVVIIPDDELNRLPMGVFVAQKEIPGNINFGQLDYLIKKYQLACAISSDWWLNHLSQRNSKPSVAGFAPDFSLSAEGATESLVPLKNSSAELAQTGRWFQGQSYIGSQATRSTFEAEAARGKILHLATHAVSDSSDSFLSHLYFSGETPSSPNCRLYNYEVMAMAIQSPLVVLSACDTGQGDMIRGEGVLSLARSFIQAGASSAVQTQWPVDDGVSASIMKSFYRNLAKGIPRNIALQRAQISYMEKSSPSLSHPYYWASYQLLGDKTPLVSPFWKEPLIIVLAVILLFLLLLAILMGYRYYKYLRIS